MLTENEKYFITAVTDILIEGSNLIKPVYDKYLLNCELLNISQLKKKNLWNSLGQL